MKQIPCKDLIGFGFQSQSLYSPSFPDDMQGGSVLCTHNKNDVVHYTKCITHLMLYYKFGVVVQYTKGITHLMLYYRFEVVAQFSFNNYIIYYIIKRREEEEYKKMYSYAKNAVVSYKFCSVLQEMWR